MPALEDLLVVQEHDLAIDRLRHRRETFPEQAKLDELEQQIAALDASLAGVAARRDDVVRRQQRHEDELSSVEAKIAEVDRRLYSGAVTAPRELQAMQADVASLRRHQSDIEDQILEVMQEREPLDTEVADLEQQRAALVREADALRQAIAALTAEIDVETATESEARAAAAESVPDDLLAQYEGLRARRGGVGAARLVNGRCSGCHLALSASELDRIRHQADDAVALCDQCGRILVR